MATTRTTAQMGGRRAPALASELADILRLFKSLFDPYRPELHYMRGPGPKWHAKHRPAQVEIQIETQVTPGLVRVKA